MFISLKWKALILISSALTLLGLALTQFNQSQQGVVLNAERASGHQHHKAVVRGLIQQSEQHLFQLGSWISEIHQKQPELSTSAIMSKHWSYMQANWKLDRATLYRSSKRKLGQWGSSSDRSDNALLDSVIKNNRTASIIHCRDLCTHSIAIPLRTSNDRFDILRLDLDFSHQLKSFHAISQNNIGLLSKDSPNNEHAIHPWPFILMHMTDSKNMLQPLLWLARDNDIDQLLDKSTIMRYQNSYYDFNFFTLPRYLGNNTIFIVTEDVSNSQTLLEQSKQLDLKQLSAYIALAGLFLLLMIFLPITRLGMQARIMTAMVRGNYDYAHKQGKKRSTRRWLKDEIDLLQESESELGSQLDQMQLQLQESTDELKNLAMFDNLTGLANRYCFLKEIKLRQRRFRRSQIPFALLFLDLDNFKRINDSLGHSAGDKLLGIVSKRLKSCVRTTDVVGRLGGDEFCILIDTLKNGEESKSIAKHILNTLIMPIHINGTEINISASIGIVVAPQDGLLTEELLQNADLAMYQAKALGRNKYCAFSHELTLRAARQLSLENELRNALANREFVLHFQPQVDIKTSNVCGMEALVRWNHPTKGPQGPDQFIEALEETGLIIPVGEWILKECCRLVKSWIDAGIPPIKVAVNISARQFNDPKFFSMVEKALQATQLPTKYLELEITESMVMGDVDTSFELLNRLRELGLTLSIDDFGTGYSSLSYLKALPVDILKVDRSFVMDIPYNSSDMEITAAIIAMAHKLKLKVVAEGIENHEQHAFLMRNHCDYGQGYLFSKPLTQDEIVELLSNHHEITKVS